MRDQKTPNDWKLEVVRGKDLGRGFALGADSVVLGNALNGSSGIDLSDQEANSPRRMAARQAQIDRVNGSLAIRDLQSPGGTFVNRQRLSPGAPQVLQDGDVIQLGSVQLRLSRGESDEPKPSESSNVPAFSFALKTGAICRSWDDFLAISSQKWLELRDELTSGRLAAFLAGIGRVDLSPNPKEPGTPDERLDSWIAKLPASRPANPELEVHPREVVIRASGGGATRRKIQIINAGYRLLRTTARIEPSSASWIKIVSNVPPGPMLTTDSSDLTIEVELPELLTSARSATLVIEGNGGSARVAVTLEPATTLNLEPDTKTNRVTLGLTDCVAPLAPVVRLAILGILGVLLRICFGITDRVLPTSGASPGLAGAVVILGSAGVLIGILLAIRHGGLRDLASSAFAGGIIGGMVAAMLVAIGRLVEPLTGSWGIVSALLWGLLGVGLAGLSLMVLPYRSSKEKHS